MQKLLVLCSSSRRVGRGIQPLRGNQAMFHEMLSQPLPADLKYLLINPVEARMRDDAVSIDWNNLAVTTALYRFIILFILERRSRICGNCFPWLWVCPFLSVFGLAWSKGQLTLASSEVLSAGVSLSRCSELDMESLKN